MTKYEEAPIPPEIKSERGPEEEWTVQEEYPGASPLDRSASTREKGCSRISHEVPWLPLITLTVTNIFLGIFLYAFSFLYVEFVETFGVSRAVGSWVGSIQLFVSMVTGIFFSGPIRHYGNRRVTLAGTAIVCVSLIASSFAPNIYVLYVTYGLTTGLGLAALYMIIAVVSQQQFHTYRTFLTCIVSVGYGIGQFICPAIIVHLIQTYSWRGTLLLISGIFAHAFIAGMLLPAAPRNDNSSHNTGAKINVRRGDIKTLFCETFDFSLLADPAYCLYSFGTFLVRVTAMALLVHAPSWIVHQGINKKDAALLVMVQSAISILVRSIMGLVADAKCVDRFVIHTMGALFIAISTALLPCWPTKPGIIVSFVIYALHMGCWNTLVPVILVDLLGVENIGRSYAINSFFFGFASLLGPPFTGCFRLAVRHHSELRHTFLRDQCSGSMWIRVDRCNLHTEEKTRPSPTRGPPDAAPDTIRVEPSQIPRQRAVHYKHGHNLNLHVFT